MSTKGFEKGNVCAILFKKLFLLLPMNAIGHLKLFLWLFTSAWFSFPQKVLQNNDFYVHAGIINGEQNVDLGSVAV